MSAFIHYTFMWLALGDACPKCQRLNGRTFVDPPIYRSTLWDPVEGDLFDLERGVPLTHPNCRCQLTLHTVQIDTAQLFGELKATLLELRNTLLERKRG